MTCAKCGETLTKMAAGLVSSETVRSRTQLFYTCRKGGPHVAK